MERRAISESDSVTTDAGEILQLVKFQLNNKHFKISMLFLTMIYQD
jgi:hypothetical protein